MTGLLSGARRSCRGSLAARVHALLDLCREEVEGEGARRLVGADPLAIQLAALHVQFPVPAKRRATAERDRHGFGDHGAVERLRGGPGHWHPFEKSTATDGRGRVTGTPRPASLFHEEDSKYSSDRLRWRREAFQ